MAIVAITGDPGCRPEEAGAAVARDLNFEFIDEARLQRLFADEFPSTEISPRAWAAAAGSVIASLATTHHIVLAVPCAEKLASAYAASLRVHLTASLNRRIGNVMLSYGLDRPAAKLKLKEIETSERDFRLQVTGRSKSKTDDFHLQCNVAEFDGPKLTSLIRDASATLHLRDQGFLTASGEAQMQFRFRLQLAKHGITPAGKRAVKQKSFGHPSEEMFANLLDFYRIRWEYEPRSFPLQWDKDGNITEAFTPDFYLPEFDLYVELTTMKQALVTRKNRKVKLLRAIYPHVNVQVFYQKDFQDLVFKYGLSEKVTTG
jgi:cytidylate kinase